jgi:hypothetical protein
MRAFRYIARSATMPTAPPDTASTTLSVRNCRTSRAAGAERGAHRDLALA